MVTQEQAAKVKAQHVLAWLLNPNVVSVAVIQDTDGTFFIGIGVYSTEIGLKVERKINNVPIRILDHRRITPSMGATDISHTMR